MVKARTAAGLVALALLAAACGGGTEDDASGDTGDNVPSVEAPSVPLLLTSSDFEQVCGGGTVSQAPAYEKTKGEIHPILAFSGEDPEYEELVLDFPEGWATEILTPEATELVACLDRTKDTVAETCKGYESDDNPGETFAVELHDATYDVTVYAASSGDVITEGTIEASGDDCPLIAFFDEGEETQVDYADPSKQLRSLVAKFVAP